MAYFAPLPDFSTSPEDALPRAAPARTPRPATVSPEMSILESEGDYTVFIVESRHQGPSSAPGTNYWELRPYFDHPGGRAWKRNPHRVPYVPGIFINGALAFTSPYVALRCAASLRDARRGGWEFRVLRVQIRRELTVVDPATYGDPLSWTSPEAQEARITGRVSCSGTEQPTSVPEASPSVPERPVPDSERQTPPLPETVPTALTRPLAVMDYNRAAQANITINLGHLPGTTRSY